MTTRHAGIAVAALALLLTTGAVRGDTPPAPARVVPLLTQLLADLPGKEVSMLTVEYLPGGASLPHRHDALANGREHLGQRTGLRRAQEFPPHRRIEEQVFYEAPGDVHQVSANASRTEPARFLVVALKDQGRALSRPVAAAGTP